MSFRQTFEGSDRKSVISALDGRTKLSFLLLYAFMMIIVDNGRSLFILFTLTLLFISWEKRRYTSGKCFPFFFCWVSGVLFPARPSFSARIQGRLSLCSFLPDFPSSDL